MTQGQKQPPEAPPDAAEAAPSTKSAPFTARLSLAEHPTLRERRRRFWAVFTARDWLAIGSLLLVGTAGLQLLRDQVQQMRPEAQLIGEGLLLALATLTGALLIYTILRRALLAQGALTDSLAALARQQLTESRDLLSAVRDWVAGAYAIGQQEGRADYAALLAIADAAQVRADALAEQLATRRLPTALDTLAEEVAALQRSVAEGLAQAGDHDQQLTEIAAQTDAIGAELARLRYARQQLDATDRQILDLLSADPALTDEEIGRRPGVMLERSQVTRRRNRLAAAGYAAAQKRQGQRPSAR